jgi:hydrogenase nickel incorporation protein HypB
VLVINMIDLLPDIPFDMERFKQGVEILNPGLTTFEVSCQTEKGLPGWIQWTRDQIEQEE